MRIITKGCLNSQDHNYLCRLKELVKKGGGGVVPQCLCQECEMEVQPPSPPIKDFFLFFLKRSVFSAVLEESGSRT
jgi:hypothetical protein